MIAAPARLLHDVVRGLAEFALPQRCPACGAGAEPERLLCAACTARIPRLAIPVCARCLLSEREAVGCRRHARPVWAAWVYDERAALVVQALKYDERPGLASGLGPEIARAAVAVRPDVVVDVPLHPSRRRERGYNQAERLAVAVADTLGAPFVPNVLERVRATAPQARLTGAARRRNVAGAFRVGRPAWLAGRSVLIVDDVVTTGGTLDACLGALEAAGARAAAATLAWAQ